MPLLLTGQGLLHGPALGQVLMIKLPLGDQAASVALPVQLLQLPAKQHAAQLFGCHVVLLFLHVVSSHTKRLASQNF